MKKKTIKFTRNAAEIKFAGKVRYHYLKGQVCIFSEPMCNFFIKKGDAVEYTNTTRDSR